MAKIRQFVWVIALVVTMTCLMATEVFGQTSIKNKPASGSGKLSREPAVEAKPRYDRVQTLRHFLEKFDSPLATYSSVFVRAADTYNIDWRLLPAITGVESTFGKRIPYKSFNAYGWSNGGFRFASWEASIWYVSRFLRKNYMDRGLLSVSQISRVYAPPSTTWAGKVRSFMEQIVAAPVYQIDL